MKLVIKGVKNILDLEYEIEENKVNYIFGISGTGKSSIVDAITDDKSLLEKIKYNNDKTVEQEVSIDGLRIDNKNFLIFDNDSLEEFIFSKDSSSNATDILVDANDLNNIICDFNESIKELKSKLNENYELRHKYLNILSETGVKKVKTKNALSKTCNLYKGIDFIRNTDYNTINNIFLITPKKAAWIKEGLNFCEDNLCPFCANTINNERFEYLNQFTSVDPNLAKNVPSNSFDLFSDNDQKNKQMLYIENYFLEMLNACDEYDNLIDKFSNLTIDTPDNIRQLNITLSDNIIKFFPKLKEFNDVLQERLEEVKHIVIITINKTKKLLRYTTKIINDELKLLGIPYNFETFYSKQQKTQYKLVLNDNKGDDEDYKINMSAGEKIIFSLLLFLHRVKKSNCKYVIIDDPVSSYDAYRRSLIYKLIHTYCKDKTAIVLSHDSVFAKYAVLNNYKNESAKYMINTNGKITFKKITKCDFISFEKSIINRLKKINNSGNYYIKILNLRLLYDARRKTKNIRYSYLSAILHGVPRDKIVADDGYLIDRNGGKTNYTEDEIILKINKEVKHGVILEKIPSDYTKNIKTTSFHLFEKILLLREFAFNHKTNEFKNVYDELSDYAHCNAMLQIVLNPYEFPLCSKKIYNLVLKYVKEYIDLN